MDLRGYLDRLGDDHRLERERIHLLLIDDAQRGLADIEAGRTCGADAAIAQRLYGTTASLKIPPGSALEALRDDRKGQHSMRIHQQWRVCFVWTPEGAANVELVDYRDGRHRPSAVPLLRPE
jgi:hypothetical protein